MRPLTNDSIEPPIVIQDLRSEPESISRNITLGEPLGEQIQLFNFGDDPMTNFEITSEFDFIEFEIFENLSGKEIQNLSLTIDPELPGRFKGTIDITYTQNNETKTLFFPLDFFILPTGSNTPDFVISNHVKNSTETSVIPE